MNSTERPGVYSEWDASSVITARAGARGIGAVGLSQKGEMGRVVMITRLSQALEAFGEDTSGLYAMIKVALQAGAAHVQAVGIPKTSAALEDYTQGFALLGQKEDVPFVICDSIELNIQQALRNAVNEASGARRERMGLVGLNTDTVETLTARADNLQSERMLLVGPRITDSGGNVMSGHMAAAVLAGVLASETDPALPIGGAVLPGAYGVSAQYTDSEVDLLIAGGVTPLEVIAGQVIVIRGITTRTKTAGVLDATWKDLSTIRIADYVIPTLRRSLKVKFARAKNTAQVRGAIKSLVVMELEQMKSDQIISGYEGIAVEQSAEQPTVCIVTFSFRVAHTLNQIRLTAHILV